MFEAPETSLHFFDAGSKGLRQGAVFQLGTNDGAQLFVKVGKSLQGVAKGFFVSFWKALGQLFPKVLVES